jgi:2-hydroxymuconate-semialdehyde hydrolase
MSTSLSSPEIGQSIRAGALNINYHDHGTGFPVLMIHGSGPGVSAWVNWRLVIPELSKDRRVLAPDMAGFGFTERVPGMTYSMEKWVEQAISFIDALELPVVDLVGNSFGGALSLALTIKHPERVRRLVLMGAAGVSFKITPALDAVWGYEPSFENMRSIMDVFAYDRGLVNDDLARLRYEASVRPGFHESYSSMFPAPRQRWVDALASDEHAIASIEKETLIVHGREDKVIPLENSQRLSQLISRSQLHVFGRCGHWTQIEHSKRFSQLVSNFLAES